MANEITISVAMKRQHATNTVDKHVFETLTYLRDQSGVGTDDRKHTIGTTEESITFTDIASNGMCLLHNLDTTNYVEVGFSTGVYGMRLLAKDTAGPFRLNSGATLFLRANTAACRVRIVHYEA